MLFVSNCGPSKKSSSATLVAQSAALSQSAIVVRHEDLSISIPDGAYDKSYYVKISKIAANKFQLSTTDGDGQTIDSFKKEAELCFGERLRIELGIKVLKISAFKETIQLATYLSFSPKTETLDDNEVTYSCFLSSYGSAIFILSENTEQVTFVTADDSILINAGLDYTATDQVTLNLQSSDVTEMYITNNSSCNDDGVWEPFKNLKTWTLAKKNDKNTVYFKAKRKDGSVGSCISDDIIHDDVAPGGTLLINDGAEVTEDRYVTLLVKSTGQPRDIYITNTEGCLSGGEWQPSVDNQVFKDWPLSKSNDTVFVYMKFRDIAMNESECLKGSIRQFTKAPVTGRILINGGDASTEKLDVNLSLSVVSDVNPEMYITNDSSCSTGGNWEAFADKKSWTLNGPFTSGQMVRVYVKYRDRVDNVSTCITDTIEELSSEDSQARSNFVETTAVFSSSVTGSFSQSPLLVSFDLSQGVSDFQIQDLLVTGGRVENLSPIPAASVKHYTFNVYPSGVKQVTIKLRPGSINSVLKDPTALSFNYTENIVLAPTPAIHFDPATGVDKSATLGNACSFKLYNVSLDLNDDLILNNSLAGKILHLGGQSSGSECRVYGIQGDGMTAPFHASFSGAAGTFTPAEAGDQVMFDQTLYPAASNKITLTAWIRPDLDKNELVFYRGSAAGYLSTAADYIASNDPSFSFGRVSGGKLLFSVTGQEWARADLLVTAPITDGKWHFIAAVFNGSVASSHMKVYMDGSELGAYTITNGTLGFLKNASSFPTYIGTYPLGASEVNYTFTGKIGPSLIYNEALSPSQILQTCQAQKGRFSEIPSNLCPL